MISLDIANTEEDTMWLVRFDQYAIDRVESWLHRFQKETGKDNFWVARKLLKLPFILYPASIALNYAYSLNKELIVPALFLLYVLIRDNLYYPKLLKEVENEAYEALENGLSNPFKLWGGIQRRIDFSVFLFYLAAAPLAHIFWVIAMVRLWEWSVDLTLSCTPLPPCKGKIKERIGNLVGCASLGPSASPAA